MDVRQPDQTGRCPAEVELGVPRSQNVPGGCLVLRCSRLTGHRGEHQTPTDIRWPTLETADLRPRR